jgi:ribosomal protein S18 acetylase RimI-like enzyme
MVRSDIGLVARYPPVSPPTDLERMTAFLRRVDEGASTSVEPFEHGTAYLNDRLPRVYDRNFVLVTDPDVTPAELTRSADRLLGGAGLAHRKVVFEDEAPGRRATGALGGGGWEYRRLAVMAYRGDGEAKAPAAAAGACEVDRLALLPALESMIRMEPWGSVEADDEVVRQLSAADTAIERAVRQRCFARLVDGQVVSSCRLYSDGSIAQIEDVATVPGHRQRGHAEAVMARATREAAAAHELVFLTAVDGRWVKRWYERLGFEQVGLRYEATRSA